MLPCPVITVTPITLPARWLCPVVPARLPGLLGGGPFPRRSGARKLACRSSPSRHRAPPARGWLPTGKLLGKPAFDRCRGRGLASIPHFWAEERDMAADKGIEILRPP